MSIAEKQIHKLIANQEYGMQLPIPVAVPPTAAFVACTTGASAIGDWTELEDSLAQDTMITGFAIFLDTVDELATIQLGSGAEGSETAFLTMCMEVPVADETIFVELPFPIRRAAATRIAARFYTATDGGTGSIKLHGYSAASYNNSVGGGSAISKQTLSLLLDANQNHVYDVLPLPAATTFQVTLGSCTPGAAWATDGTAVELEDATLTYRYLITHLIIAESATVGTEFELDICIGADGSEVARATISCTLGDANASKIIPLKTPIPVQIGERVSIVPRGGAETVIKAGVVVLRGFEL